MKVEIVYGEAVRPIVGIQINLPIVDARTLATARLGLGTGADPVWHTFKAKLTNALKAAEAVPGEWRLHGAWEEKNDERT